MKHISIYESASGKITAQASLLYENIEANLASGESWIEGSFDGKKYYVVNESATLRPEVAVSETHTLPANTDWTITPVPEGTKVFTDGELVGTVGADEELTLSFPDTGTWTIKMITPFPWLDANSEVIVT